MKVALLFLASFIAISLGRSAITRDGEIYEIKKLGIKLNDIASEGWIKKVLKALKNFSADGNASGIFNMELNPLLDEILDDFRLTIIRNGMDPLKLDDNTKRLSILGSINLTSGWLQDLSTISRNRDVIVTYNSATKRLTFSVPLRFKVLLFTYKYVTKITLLKFKGDIQGKIDNVHMNLRVSYIAGIQGFILDNVDMTNSGKVTVLFAGNRLVDWLTNAMTMVTTKILHALIVRILQARVESIGNEILDGVNEYINH